MVVPTSGLRDGKIRKKDVEERDRGRLVYVDESRKLVVETGVML
jgi:DNA transposition AAA+ family ATPase